MKICQCTSTLTGTDQPPTISGPESDTAVKTNGTATLRCTVNAALKPEWHTGSPFSSLSPASISSDKHYKLNESQTSLVVTGFRNRHHGGEYTCKFQSKPFTQVLLSCPGKLSHASTLTSDTCRFECSLDISFKVDYVSSLIIIIIIIIIINCYSDLLPMHEAR